ncbi:cytochrome P450 81Q32-like [Benincasa hispida]|uniref:cytochrome P450 81Q32-like n=1 Tax=Benincasa hispida TaxID=102211 RepID=UPI0019029B1F|nr:cytochrome P450 81Q32-like [Benincasa hispida]
MDNILVYIFLFVISLLLALKLLLPHGKNLPPSPLFSLPLIGHLHLLKHPIHQNLHNHSNKYGRIFSLWFGSRLVVVVSSPSAVRECFTKNDIVLANRPFLNTGKHLTYNFTVLAVAPYGELWRSLRRISTCEIFSTSRLNLFSGIRQDEVKRLLCKLCSGNSVEELLLFSVVEVEPMLLDFTSNIVMRMVAGKRYFGDDVLNEGQAGKFRDVVKRVMMYAGATNPGDFIPLWNWIDPTGLEKKIIKVGQEADAIFQGLIDEIRTQEGGNTMIHHLLHLQTTRPEYFSDQIIKGLIHVILLAGIDTTAVTLEWALSHLFNNPEVMKKARLEIECCTGQERLVNEEDLSSLSYLQGIVLETLRLTPAAPLLVPHCASEDCQIEGYDIPRDTIIFVNAWAIHRDPNLWEDATSFKPERHENAIELFDSYKLLPFGLGRRACPGVGMAQRVVGLTLASLIQCFDWETMDGSLVDMTEGHGITMPKAQPLVAKCKPRPIMRALVNEVIHPF